MLRAWVVGLLVANGVFWAWSSGRLEAWVPSARESQREPQRLAQQQHPERLKVTSVRWKAPAPAALPSLPSASGAPASLCLEVGPYSVVEFPRVEAVLQARLPQGSWTVRRYNSPGTWMVYIGRYSRLDMMERRAEELRARNFDVSEVREPPALAPGLSLGTFAQVEEAQAVMRDLANLRIRAARIVTLTEPSIVNTLRIPAADAALQATAQELAPQLLGQVFVPCSRD